MSDTEAIEKYKKTFAAAGGNARHKALSPERRLEISKKAWKASVKARAKKKSLLVSSGVLQAPP